MFKSKSYNVKKVSEKNEKEKPQSSFSASTSSSTGTFSASTSSSGGTLRKPPSTSKTKKPPSSFSASSSSGLMTLTKREKIKSANNKESPEYRQKIYPKKTVTTWKKNETFTPKNETKKQ